MLIEHAPMRFCYCMLCESLFYAKPGEPHRCLPPVPEGKIEQLTRDALYNPPPQIRAINHIAEGDPMKIDFDRGVAYGPNPPRPNFSTAAESQRWVEQRRHEANTRLSLEKWLKTPLPEAAKVRVVRK